MLPQAIVTATDVAALLPIAHIPDNLSGFFLHYAATGVYCRLLRHFYTLHLWCPRRNANARIFQIDLSGLVVFGPPGRGIHSLALLAPAGEQNKNDKNKWPQSYP